MLELRRSHRPLIMGQSGAVASNHPFATQAGLDALRAGGNAADAAVAVAITLGVAEPMMSGLGGDGFYNLWLAAEGRGRVYNGSGSAPAAADPARYAGSGMPPDGAGAASTPGSLGALAAMHAAHGRLPWASLFRTAIALAAEGLPVTQNYRRYAKMSLGRLRKDALATATYLHEGDVPAVGHLIRQIALARTLEEVAHGGYEAFYRGALARRLAAATQGRGGIIAEADLAGFEAEMQAPVGITYRGYDILQTPPNSMGFVLLQELKIVERFDLASLGHNSADAIHIQVEAKKRAFRDRERYATDPRFAEVPLEHILSETHADAMADDIDLHRASEVPLTLPAPNEGNTTYFCIVDAEGNAVSAIQSINNPFGSGVVAGETGILLNNRMTTWHLGSHPNALKPGKRVRHTMNAPMILKDGKPWGVVGTPGADNQVQVNLQAITALIDFNLDPQAVVEAPRWFSSQPGQEANWPHGGNDALTIEEDVGEATLARLTAKGHHLQRQGHIEGTCSLECIRVLENGVRAAGSDPRRDGWAGAY
ncbi:gamma-glutamyltransferase [Acetobacteraceae bacterium H6797]|nr:gamma-glutamyltransferase [Acetobacteraceae bacterium H6797]